LEHGHRRQLAFQNFSPSPERLAVIITHPDYTYPAVVLAIHDGDTCHLDIDLGQGINLVDRDFGFHFYVQNKRLHLHEDFRFYGINAPELNTQAGKDALAFLQTLMQIGTALTAKINKGRQQEKYGRWLATLILPDGTNINDRMVATGHAVAYFP
jgi:micrococcal nuclease